MAVPVARASVVIVPTDAASRPTDVEAAIARVQRHRVDADVWQTRYPDIVKNFEFAAIETGRALPGSQPKIPILILSHGVD